MGSIIIVAIVTRSITPEAYGELNLAFTVVSFTNLVVMSGLIEGAGRFFGISKGSGRLKEFTTLVDCRLSKLSALLIITICTIAIIFNIFINIISLPILLIVTAYSIVCAYRATYESIQMANRSRKIGAMNSMIDILIKVSILSALLITNNSSVFLIVLAYILGGLFIIHRQREFIRQLVVSSADKHTNNSIDLNKGIYEFGRPYKWWGASSWIYIASDKWALMSFGSAVEVGEYSVLYQLGYTPIIIISNIFMSLVTPIVNQYADADSSGSMHKKLINQTVLAGLLATFLLCVISYVIGEGLFSYIVGPSFVSSSRFVPIMVMSAGLFAIGQSLALKKIAELTPSKITRVKVGSAIIGAVLNVFAAKYFGIIGIVYSSLLYSIFYLIWMYKRTK